LFTFFVSGSLNHAFLTLLLLFSYKVYLTDFETVWATPTIEARVLAQQKKVELFGASRRSFRPHIGLLEAHAIAGRSRPQSSRNYPERFICWSEPCCFRPPLLWFLTYPPLEETPEKSVTVLFKQNKRGASMQLRSRLGFYPFEWDFEFSLFDDAAG